MVESVETRVETPAISDERSPDALTLRMFGELAVTRHGLPVDLPPSRKVRALLGYLALAPRPVGRSRLCELLGDVPNDPRGELRWCLSKLRTILDGPERTRVSGGSEMISLDLEDCFLDVSQIELATRSGLENLDLPHLRSLCDLFAGDFLEGLDLNRSPRLDHWLTTQRSRYRACHAAILEQRIKRLVDDPQEARACAERRVELSPLDSEAQVVLLKALLRCGLPAEAEQHLAAVARLYEAEDLDFDPIRRAWQELRSRRSVRLSSAKAVAGDPAEEAGAAHAERPTGPVRASLAVMPFAERARADDESRLADGLTHDIIARLAKLRGLFVIARGSVFTLAQLGVGPEEAARRLKVDYFTSGMVDRNCDRLTVSVELVETQTARIVWSHQFDLRLHETFHVLDAIGDMIVASIAAEIETAERNRALLKAPDSLNAWEAYHRGVWHMYRFTKADNDLAYRFFKSSSAADPTFARAFAGLSFTHWQNAFQNWADRERETDLALETAGRSVIADDHDPTAHWAMGRALWLRGRQDEAVGELVMAVDLSPNFALGHYALSFVQAQSGDPAAAIASSDHSRSLSPFDPLLFGMLGARAMAHVRLGQFEEAAEWAMKAAARPNAHNIILAIAAHCLALAGRVEEGRTFVAKVRQSWPNFRADDFLSTFRFAPDAEALFREGASHLGLD